MVADRPVAEPVAALSASQRHELEEAGRRAKKVRRAATVAGFNGWSMAILAVLSALFSFGSLTGLVVAGGLGALAWNELRGRRRLLAFNVEAPALLGWNQLGLLALVGGYCVWQIVACLMGDGQLAKEIDAHPEYRDLLGTGAEFDAFVKTIAVAIYSLAILVSVAAQGLNAWYYFSRRKYVEAYLRETPAWVVELQRLAGQA